MKKMLLALASAAAVAAGTATAAPILNTANGHYYQYVATGSTWTQAFAAAAASSYNGRQGYLATITSADERAFIAANVTTLGAWLGGSDSETEGTWKWVSGPEAGQTMNYTNWYSGEPNNWGGNEDYLIMNWSGTQWNDLPDSPGYGFVVEFSGGVPEPATWAMMIGGFGAAGAVLRRRKLALA